MNTTTPAHAREGEVLRWLELALEQPSSERRAWLAARELPEWLSRRLSRLLDAELDAGGFLDTGPAVRVAVEAPRPGERLGAYEIVRELDSGGMGVVFLGRRADAAYEQQVAIKLIQPLYLGHATVFRDQLIRRFENERALLARLTHPNVARILDGGTTATGVPYLVMEFVEGVSLTAYCDRNALDVRERLRIFRKVCDGVQEAHRHLIVHRDLKPDNVLVGANGEPRLLDFGIARLLADDSPGDGATMFTAMTPAYASPEQVQRKPLTTSSDVYSLGVMLYQLLAGAPPYALHDLTPAAAERTICETTPAPIAVALRRASLAQAERQRRHAAIREDLERIVAKAMHKAPERRYASAQDLATDIDRFLEGRPVLAHPDSRAYRARKFVGRHRLGTAAAAVAFALVVAATALAFRSARHAERSASDMREVNAFLLDVLQLSDPFDSGHELTLAQALDDAAKTLDARFDGRPDLASEIRFGIGYSMVSRHRLDEADAQLTRALEESTRAFGTDDVRTLRVVEGIAGLRQEQGRNDEAERTFLDGIVRMQRARLERDPLYLTLLNNLGNLYLTQEKYAQANAWFERAAATPGAAAAANADSVNLISNLAQAAHGLGDHARADGLYREAQAKLEALFPQGSPDIAILLNNRALLAEDRGEWPDALALHRESLAMRRRVLGREHPMIVVALTNVARAALATGARDDALASAEEAAAMADRVYTEPSNRHANAYAALAEAKLQGGDVAGARTALQRAIALASELDAPIDSTTRYIERVRTAVCAKERSMPLCAAPGPDESV
jgi:eukaryotic-like serine/threonine-protein kinase